MAEIINLPRMTDTMEEGVVSSVLVKVGDSVKSGDTLAEVETDKATMPWESFVEGVILHVGIEAGDTVAVNAPVFVIGKKGEAIDALLKEFGAGGAEKSAPALPSVAAPSPVATSAPKPSQIDLSTIEATAIRMRKMTDTMEEGVLANWLVKVGDKVKVGDAVAEVETDKATMDFETYDEGTILHLAVEAGTSVPVGTILAIVGKAGADFSKILEAEAKGVVLEMETPVLEESKKEPAHSEKNTPVHTPAPAQATTPAVATTGGRIFISPLAKRLAEEKGYDLAQIVGSGEGGRIVKKDVEAFRPSAAQPLVSNPLAVPISAASEQFTEEKVSQMRKTIAKRLADSKYTAPHFYLTISINMDNAIAARKSINEVSEVKISFNDMVIKAVAMALRKHPKVNSSWRGDVIRYNQHVHIGVAVAVEEGLLVPVVRFADTKSLSQIAGEVKGYAQKAKDKKLQPSDWEGNTFTISNLGMFGIEEFTGIINPPDACILAVGAIIEQPIVRNGQIVVGNLMKMTLSCDHRVVDGAIGASFLQTLQTLLENPVRMLV
ncbi:pyruvate dehydrogenase complex dihydrolipoamide acetyltransferase [Hugenholtzia roseola]|uniref:pyruvate dehydrogenase complex dihydrolipoamide acetyltransferase n=1 Tax=Hugenholtzia roseola TaxID=1002 RepID=UPI0003FD8E99|nr:pyruvate dehydrogenase complex dihydrolipoamide acetyltransferase [Hugenholtzia roseola]